MSATAPRVVDTLPIITERPVEMQVLCLGLSRTSTMTMRDALGILGYRCYHFTEATKEEVAGNKHYACLLEAMLVKVYGRGKPFGRVEFDKLFGNYSALADTPCNNLYAELVAAYPEAKVVLTTRDPDKWVQSMEVSFYAILSWRIWRILPWLGWLGYPSMRHAHRLLELAVIDWTSGHFEDRSALRQGFITHNENVRSLVPPEKLLEFKPQNGWEPLCEFLGKNIPTTPFPHSNKGSNAANIVAKNLVITCTIQILKPVVAVFVAWAVYKWIY